MAHFIVWVTAEPPLTANKVHEVIASYHEAEAPLTDPDSPDSPEVWDSVTWLPHNRPFVPGSQRDLYCRTFARQQWPTGQEMAIQLQTGAVPAGLEPIAFCSPQGDQLNSNTHPDPAELDQAIIARLMEQPLWPVVVMDWHS